MSASAPPRRRLATVLRIAGYGCATVVVVVLLTVGFFSWRVSRYFRGTDPETMAWKAQLGTARTTAPGASVDFALDGCDLYQAPRGTDDWSSVSLPYAPGNYPAFMTACTGADLSFEDGWIYVSVCAQAIGAGGGCARGGTFRTRDATTWERHDKRGPHGPAWVRDEPLPTTP